MSQPVQIFHDRSPRPFLPGPTEDRILVALLTYDVLSATQVCRLLYSPASLSWVQARLKRLRDLGYVEAIFLPRPSRLGSAPLLYVLGSKALARLRSQGFDVPTRHRPSEQQRSYYFLRHAMAVNDVLISLEMLGRRTDVEICERRNERAMKRNPSYVADSPNRRVAVIPDAWVSLVLGGAYEMSVAFEVDRGTEEQKKWRRKVRALVAWSKGPYQDTFGTPSLTIAVVATAGERRLRDLVRWTEVELTSLDQPQEADLFRFVSAAPDAMTPENLFLSPRWCRPFVGARMPLFAVQPPLPTRALGNVAESPWSTPRHNQ